MSSTAKQTIIAFDLYGTLLSTDSIAKELATHFGDEKAQSIASLWRRYQLEYTWRLNSMNQYTDFATLTRSSLSHALTDSSLSLPDPSIASLLRAYDSLSTFPDVAPALQILSSHRSLTAVVFSNGTASMLSASVHSSPDLSPHASVFQALVSVDEVRRYKPAPEAYYHLAEQVGKGRGQMGEMWLVSGNPFDVVGARAVGMRAVWVDRGGKGWADGLVGGEEWGPTAVVGGLGEVVEVVRRVAEGGGR